MRWPNSTLTSAWPSVTAVPLKKMSSDSVARTLHGKGTKRLGERKRTMRLFAACNVSATLSKRTAVGISNCLHNMSLRPPCREDRL